MKCWVGLGSNLGDRRANLERATQLMKAGFSELRVSPVFENPALVPSGAPLEWRRPFLNAVAEFTTADLSSLEILRVLKAFENQIGRGPGERWSPRTIDLDLLSCGDQVLNGHPLQLPHKEMWQRHFVLGPLKHLCPDFHLPGQSETALTRSRAFPGGLPLWMGIFNLTPDSFSDGGQFESLQHIQDKVSEWDQAGVHILDFGAESTRPSAKPLTPDEEWNRLAPALRWTKDHFRGRDFRPLISVDTYHPQTAERALELGVDIINDVSGLASTEMASVLRQSDCAYVLMHSLSIPADPKKCLPEEGDPVLALKTWVGEKLAFLRAQGVEARRVIFDPGIGFGKTALQSLEILRRIDEFADLPVRLMIGHSRKSFYNFFGERPAPQRDWETLATSLKLAGKVDILRVHEPSGHIRAHRVWQELSP